jgi:Animal haem peroxidase
MSSTESSSNTFSRREFLGALGVGAVAVPGMVGISDAQAQQMRPRRFVLREDRFGRMFPRLPPFARASKELAAALMEIGKPQGIMDPRDDLQNQPDDANPDNPTHTAGTTFMGQFFDHDLTFDLTSRLGVPTEPTRSPNLRSPAFDLDSVYGGGPREDPELYQPRADAGRRGGRLPGIKLRIENGGMFEDLPRMRDGVAIISDPRNDENLIIAGIQAAMILFHNRAVDVVAAANRRDSPEEVFRKAQRLAQWHYQWMVVHEFLPLFIGQQTVDQILRRGGRKFFTPDIGFIPIEFQAAAYRFGHSMVRPAYPPNIATGFLPIFDRAQDGVDDPNDLRGGFRAPRRFVDWETFFDFGLLDGNGRARVRRNKQIDTKLSTPLFNLPLVTFGGEGPTALPQRNLLRHLTWGVPSGQNIAKAMGMPVLSAADLAELKGFGQHLDTSTPLFYYILKEAKLAANGLTLGPVGGRIVGEVFIALLQLDRDSYLSVNPRWRPTLPDRFGRLPGDFRMVDFLSFAGVAPPRSG